jgi:CubicO group peptidase (beta-lactamase class C family)
MTMRIPLLLLALPATLAAQNGARLLELDRFTTQAVRDWNVPGLSIAVVHEGRVVFAKGYGVLELGRATPVDTQTLFAIGSTTKAMTTMALAMLVDDGKLSWDDPVTKHLPGFQLNDPYVTREITVRDLVTHQAGLPNVDFLWSWNDLPGDEVVRRLRYVRSAYSLRSSFIYQNIMYAVAGEVVRAASGMPWGDFLRTRIFQPLGMTRTVTTLADAARASNVATPHAPVRDTLRAIANNAVDAVAPAGSVWSSTADMSKWIRFLLDSGRVGDKRLVKQATFEELVRPQLPVPAPEFYPTAQLTRPHWTTYGLAWFQQDYRGRKIDFHTGSIDGMVAIVGLMLDERLGVVVLSNGNQSNLRHALMLKTFDLFTGAPPRDWSQDLKKLYDSLTTRGVEQQRAAAAQRVTGTRPSLDLAKYAGTYSDSLYGTRVVTFENGELRMRASSKSVATLSHWQYDTFQVRWDQPWRGSSAVTFTIGPAGVPSRLEQGAASFRRVR